jgi:hypothetical protein
MVGVDGWYTLSRGSVKKPHARVKWGMRRVAFMPWLGRVDSLSRMLATLPCLSPKARVSASRLP